MASPVEILCELVSGLVLLLAFLLRPVHARCPPNWHNNGIRPSGEFACTRNPVGDMDWSWASRRPDRSIVPPGELRGHIYCTHGTRPIVIDDRAVGCQPFR